MGGQFPATLDEVRPEWLTHTLRDNGAPDADTSVTVITVLPIGSGFGQTGEAVRLQLDYDSPAPAAPATVFAKFATKDEVRRRASQKLDLYAREVDFYTRLASQAKVRAPGCYFAAVAPDGDYATLILEDFPHHRPGDDIEGLKLPEAEEAVTLLTHLHAPFWNRGLEQGLAPLSMGNRNLFVRAWDEVERSYGEFMPAAVRRHREAYLDAVEPLHAWLLTGPVTVGHGDLKLDNILFGGSDDPIVAVDWQAVRPQRGMRDIAYLISHSMNVADRRAHEHALIDRYTTSLSSYDIDYPSGEAREDYRISMLFDFCTALYIAGVNLNTNERAIRRKRKLMERCVTALLDWDAFDLLDRFR